MRAVTGALLGAAFTGIAWAVAGASLGLLLGGVFVAMVLVPLLDDARGSIASRSAFAAALMHAPTIIWITAAACTALTLSQCLQAYVILVSITSVGFGLRLVHFNAQTIVLLGVAWFVSPVLLANVMIGPHGRAVASAITRYHPLFALNRVVIDQGAWTSSEFAYQHLTPLGQDVPYTLPDTVLPCALAHALVTAGCALIFAVLVKRGQKATVLC